MRSALANRTSPPFGTRSNSTVDARSTTANANIPIGEKSDWQLKAISRVLDLKYELSRPNWDTYGSAPVANWVIDAAIWLVGEISVENLPTPRVVPVSGGGLQLEWSNANKELELYLSPDRSIEVLKIRDGVPIDDGEILVSVDTSIKGILSWLNAA